MGTWFREAEQGDVLEVPTVMLRHDIERLPKVTRCRDVVATQGHDELPEHYQIFLDLLCGYGRPGQVWWRGGVIHEYVGEPTRADPHAILACNDDFGDVNHSYR